VAQAVTRGAGTPWLANARATLRTVRGEVAQDPVQFALQLSRRLPDAVTRPVAGLLTRAGALAGGAVAAVGHQVLGHEDAARHALDGAGVPGARGATVMATAALGSGDAATAGALLESVPDAGRNASWYAAAARVALYRGDVTGAVELARRHGRNRALAARLEAERRVLAGHRPDLGAARDAPGVPGRVLHVLTSSLPHTTSGYAQRSHGVLRTLAGAGFDVHAVTRPGYPVEVGIPWARCEDEVDGVHYRRLLPGPLAQDAVARLDQHARLLSAEVERVRPVLLHTTTHFTNALVVEAVARAHGLPWVYEVRGQRADSWAATRPAEALDSEYYREFCAREDEAARAADAVVTLGEQMQARLLGAGVPAGSIRLCPNAVDEAFVPEPPGRTAARARLGLDPDDVLVGTVSSVVDYEGLDVLVRAVARLAPQHPRLRLRIVGDGVSLPALRVLARDLGVADRCQFTGRVPRSEARWNHAALDVFVVPRRDLPVTRAVTPMKTVEASASARPVVASDLPALAELVQDGVTGLLVPPGDDAALADALAGLMTDPGRRQRLGEAGRAWALRTRTWQHNAEAYTAVYAALGVEPGARP
jgi:glycosyltransferase involved in cell wall biosynthesis